MMKQSVQKFVLSDERIYVKWRIGLFVVASLMIMAGIAWWSLRPQYFIVAVPEGLPDHYARMQLWAKYLERNSTIRLDLRKVDSATRVAELIADGTAHLGVLRVDDQTPSLLRSVTILTRRAILTRPKGQVAESDNDTRFLENALSNAGLSITVVLRDIVDARPLPATAKGIPGSAQIRSELPYLLPITLTGTAEAEIETLAITVQLVARFDAAKSDIADISRWVENGRRELAAGHPSSVIFPSTDEDQSLRAHDGVYAFRSREESTYLERNSDFLYLLLAVLGGLASLIGAIWANFKSQLRDGGVRYLGRLETLTKELREAETQERIRRVGDTGLQLAQRFAREMASHQIERRVEAPFQMLYGTFREEFSRKMSKEESHSDPSRNPIKRPAGCNLRQASVQHLFFGFRLALAFVIETSPGNRCQYKVGFAKLGPMRAFRAVIDAMAPSVKPDEGPRNAHHRKPLGNVRWAIKTAKDSGMNREEWLRAATPILLAATAIVAGVLVGLLLR